MLAPYVESLLSGGQKVSLAITKWLAKSGTVIPGFAAEGALANEGEMKERAKEGAVAALMAPIYVGVGMLSEALAGSLVKPVADRALITRWLGGQEGWNPRVASATCSAQSARTRHPIWSWQQILVRAHRPPASLWLTVPYSLSARISTSAWRLHESATSWPMC